MHIAAAHGWTPPVTLQPQYNLLVRDIEHEVVPACLDAGLGLLPWSPLAGGWLTGKYQRDVAPDRGRPGSARTRSAAWRPGTAAQRGRAHLGASSTRSARSPRRAASRSAQVALAWLAAAPAVTSVILGARTVEQLADNLGAADLDLGRTQLARLDEASAPRIDDYPYGAPGRAQRHRSLTGGR